MSTMIEICTTFDVDDVTPTSESLRECRIHEAVKRSLNSEIESCCDYHTFVVDDVTIHPLLAAVHIAFSDHRPLVLSPDAIWIAIAQGVAHHMALHGESLRSRFVAHQGKLELAFVCSGWTEGSPENPWPEAFDSWGNQIRDHVGKELHDMLVCDFSTTSSIERTVSQIVMMDVFQRYFHYVLYGVCGIPTITLEGTPSDWQRLCDKVAALSVFDLDWWLTHLRPICEHFARASRGDVDVSHWQAICKLRSAYGGDIINGWIAMLFPYLPEFADGPCSLRNPIFETGEGIHLLNTPPSLSRVPFSWRNVVTQRARLMEAIAGFVGVTQDLETLALKPKVGWAVRKSGIMDVLLTRLAKEHETFAGRKMGENEGMPSDLCKFYHHTDGANLFGNGASAACRILAWDKIEPLDCNENPDSLSSFGPNNRIWHRFAWLSDGRWLAVNLDINNHLAPWRCVEQLEAKSQTLHQQFSPICIGAGDSIRHPSPNPVVAFSFTELLEKLLASDGRFDFPPTEYGDAEQYTRSFWPSRI